MGIESNVNNYSKVYPAIFEYAEGDVLIDQKGKKYIDFFCGAGTLNYGHNNPILKKHILPFFENNYPVHCLDMDTKVKLNFLDKFNQIILKPRGFNHKIQFPSPSGTNAVEAAIKLARKVTGRSTILSFTNSFHGMTATSLALSASKEDDRRINPLQDVIFFPYEGFSGIDSIKYLEMMLTTKGSGVGLPAAIILETVQAEGGVNIGSDQWLQEIRRLTLENGIVLIIDDIQVGCGRTGCFFSFERANINPDIILLSKSISGYGFPLSLVLIKPEIDLWYAGEHNGTFRANNLALHTASAALEFWIGDAMESKTKLNSTIISSRLNHLLGKSNIVVDVRGIGMIWGIELVSEELTSSVAKSLFDQGLMIETCGNKGQVLKLLPSLTISETNLTKGLDLIINEITRMDKEISLSGTQKKIEKMNVL